MAHSFKGNGFATFLLLSLVSVASLDGCCPDAEEFCKTPAEWEMSRLCTAFPPLVNGVCPSLEQVRMACPGLKTGGRQQGNQCCYDLQASCE